MYAYTPRVRLPNLNLSKSKIVSVFSIEVFLNVILRYHIMGFSNEQMREIMKMEYEMERTLFDNFQRCKFSSYCPAMPHRLDAMPRKNTKHCLKNPGIKECRMYQFLDSAIGEYDLSADMGDCDELTRFNKDMAALCVEIEEKGWK